MEAREQQPKALFIVVNAGYSDEVIEIAREAGARGATVLNARGEGATHEVFMGITVDSEKEIILCVVGADIADKVMEAVKQKAGIETASHGVCFSLPIDKMVGIGTFTA